MLDNQELHSEDNPPDTSDDKPTHKGGESHNGLSSISAPLQAPKTPSAANPTPNKPYKWRDNLKLAIELLGLSALIVYTIFSVLQWAQIRYTNKLTARALDGSDKALSQTLTKMQGQIDAANTANSLLKQSLIGNEAAYVVAENSGEFSQQSMFTRAISVSFRNTGKISAINFLASITYSKVALPDYRILGKAETLQIRRDRLPPIQSSAGSDVVIAAPYDPASLTPEDRSAIVSADEAIQAETSYSYDDGFGERVSQHQCWLLVYYMEPETRQTLLRFYPCIQARSFVSDIYNRRKAENQNH